MGSFWCMNGYNAHSFFLLKGIVNHAHQHLICAHDRNTWVSARGMMDRQHIHVQIADDEPWKRTLGDNVIQMFSEIRAGA